MTGGWVVLAAVAAALAVLLVVPHRVRLPTIPADAGRTPADGTTGRPPVLHLAAPVLGGVAAWVMVGGLPGVAAGVVVGLVARRLVARAEPHDVRRRREQAARELPMLVELLAATLRSGASPAGGLGVVCDALPGPVADRLAGVRSRLDLGSPPAVAWVTLADDPVLAPLGRALARAETTGASVVTTVERLAEELEREELGATEDRARAVGVRAAVPLGLCLLPGFMLLGIVPTVAGLVTTLLG